MSEKEITAMDKNLTNFDPMIFSEKYAMKDTECNIVETNISQTFRRSARTLADGFSKTILPNAVDRLGASGTANLEQEFYACMAERRGILAGRPLLALGNPSNITALNCFVVPVDDSIESIYDNQKLAAKIQQAGGGFGTNFSKVRPNGALVKGVASTASGPIPFMHSWDAMIQTMKSAGNRRGAGIAVLNVDHPDIMEFITAKRDSALTNFNISVGITNEFIQALKNDDYFELKHNGIVYNKLKAKEVFNKLVENGYNYNEPGLMFIDKINEVSNSYYYQTIESTNPCGEIPLPDWGCCDLGMIILPTFVKNPFVNQEIDIDSLKKTVKTMVYMLDTVLDVTKYPLKQNEKVALQDRRIGLGITGLGDMLAMLKIPYDSDEAVSLVDVLMQTIRNSAYEASISLSKLKGPFPKYDKAKFLSGKFIESLPEHIKMDISEHGIRNVSILTCQPAGTVSLLLNNVSSGIEPIFSLKQKRRIRDEKGNLDRKVDLLDYAYKYYINSEFRKQFGEKPSFFQTSKEVSLSGHLRMQNKIQQYIDNSISKTINFQKETTLEEYSKFMFNVLTGKNYIKGLTTFRDGTIQSILIDTDKKTAKAEKDEYRKKSFSYQIRRSSGSPSAHVHITFTDNYVAQVFVNSRDIEFYKETLPYTRLLSMIFQKEKSPEYMIKLLDELEEFDFVEMDEKYIYKDKTYNHFLSALKECLWDTLIAIGLVKNEDEDEEPLVDEDMTESSAPKCHCGLTMHKEGKCWMCSCGSSSGMCEL